MQTKKLFLLANLLLAGFCVNAQPQQQPNPPKPPTPEERVKHVSEKMEKELQLTSVQKEKLAAAYKDFFAEIEKEKNKNGKPADPPPPPPPPVSKKVADKLSQVRDAKIKAILSVDQFKKYIELEKNMRPPMPPGKPGEAAVAPPKKQ